MYHQLQLHNKPRKKTSKHLRLPHVSAVLIGSVKTAYHALSISGVLLSS